MPNPTLLLFFSNLTLRLPHLSVPLSASLHSVLELLFLKLSILARRCPRSHRHSSVRHRAMTPNSSLSQFQEDLPRNSPLIGGLGQNQSSGSGCGSASGISTQMTLRGAKSGEESDDTSSSNNEDDTGSIDLNILGGSDHGSGTQAILL